LKIGERLTLEELIYALMLNSANDAAVAIALHFCDSVDDFVSLMNIKAWALCMNDTVYATPNGLPARGQYSTAHDQAILACYALSVDGFERICSAYTHSIPYDGVANGRYLKNHNRLLRSYQGCIGMKTGYTKSAGRCLVTCARREGVTLICVTLRAPDDWNDHRALLDKGFSLFLENTE
jgi:D-alanyl-D-alanine carboxypeptidase